MYVYVVRAYNDYANNIVEVFSTAKAAKYFARNYAGGSELVCKVFKAKILATGIKTISKEYTAYGERFKTDVDLDYYVRK